MPSGWTGMSQVEGSGDEKGCAHVARCQLPWVQEKGSSFQGRGLANKENPGALSCQDSEQVSRLLLRKWCLYLTDRMKGKLCITDVPM